MTLTAAPEKVDWYKLKEPVSQFDLSSDFSLDTRLIVQEIQD